MASISSSKNWYIQIPGVTNPDTTPTEVDGQIEILDFNQFMKATVTAIGKAAGKPTFNDCNVQMKGAAAAPVVFTNMLNGVSLGEVVVTGLLTTEKQTSPFVQFTYGNCYTTSMSVYQAHDGDLQIAAFSFAFATIKVQVWNETTGGSMVTLATNTYNLLTQKAQ
jgi:type VI protein secretion system component Hcp